MQRYRNRRSRVEVSEEMSLESRGDGGLKFLDAFIGAAAAVAVHLAEGGDVEFCFNQGGC